jgi:predicted DNA-binding ribbon-helix-helix protein
MNSPVAKHSVVVNGNKTSVSLEAPFWEVLREIARAKGTTMSELTSEIDGKRRRSSLSSALRLFVLHACQERAAEASGKRLSGSPEL